MKSKHRLLIERLEIRRLLAAVEGLDTSFGKNGLADVPADALFAQLPNGEYLAIGTNQQTDLGVTVPNVSLLTSSGGLDKKFGNDGRLIVPVPGSSAYGVLAGNKAIIVSNLNGGLAQVMALGLDGKIDASFGTDGFVKVPTPPLTKGDVFDGMDIDSIAAQSDGSAIIAFRAVEAPKGGGTMTTLTEMERVTPSGTFDSDFGTNGFVLVGSHVKDVDSQPSTPHIVVDSHDRIILTTEIDFQSSTAQVDRFNADGTLDTTFGDNGVVQLHDLTNDAGVAVSTPIYAIQATLQADDKIIVGGIMQNNQSTKPAQIIRLDTDGKIDSTFGTNGQVQISSPEDEWTGVDEARVDSQGRIVIVDGSSITRLTSTGALDPDFGTDGIIDMADAVRIAHIDVSGTGAIVDADDGLLISGRGGVVRFGPQPAAVLESDGTLRINGSDDEDIVGISARNEILHANVNGTVLKFKLSDVKTIDFELGAGDNTANEYVDINAIVNVTSTADETDSIQTGGGNDAITVAGGNVTIDSGAGNDHIHAGAGDFTIHGGVGNDWIVARAASSAVIFGEDGKDTIVGSSGNDSIYGGAGLDSIHGGFGNDLINGNGGNDRLFGQDGHDHIHGGDGDDIINSIDNAVDVVDGGAGTDSATVDNGLDLVTNVENGV